MKTHATKTEAPKVAANAKPFGALFLEKAPKAEMTFGSTNTTACSGIAGSTFDEGLNENECDL
jgi:hypothetical protein